MARIGATTRRRLLATGVRAAALTAAGGIARPSASRAGDGPRPDAPPPTSMAPSRSGRPARMLVEVATNDSFAGARTVAYVDALPDTDFTATMVLDGLPPGREIYYRVRLQGLPAPAIPGEPAADAVRATQKPAPKPG